jgi:hypothetical protein
MDRERLKGNLDLGRRAVEPATTDRIQRMIDSASGRGSLVSPSCGQAWTEPC